MNLSLLLGVSSFAKQEGQSFASAGQVSTTDGSAAAPAALSGADTASLAGVFHSLVDELMLIDGEQRADDAAPAANVPAASEADDFAATLETSGEGDEQEWNELPQAPKPQVWLVELEIINRAVGAPTDFPRRAPLLEQTKPVDLPQDKSDELSRDNATLAMLVGAVPVAVPPPASAPVLPVVAVVPEKPDATEVAAKVPAEQAPQTAVAEVPGDLPTAHATVFEAAPQQLEQADKKRDHAKGKPVEAAPESPSRRRTAPASLPAAVQPARTAPVLPAVPAAPGEQPEPEPDGVPRTAFDVRRFGPGFTAPRSGVTKPEGVTQNVESRTLNQNVERPIGNAEQTQAFIAPETVSANALESSITDRPTKAAQKGDVPSSQHTSDVRPGLVTRASEAKQSDDLADSTHRQPESHAPVARTIVADVQAQGPSVMASATHELLSARNAPASQPSTVVVTPFSANQSALPDETANQIVQAIRFQVIRGGGEATIRLEPKHFGELSITVRVEQGQVNARIQAESPSVREYLQNHQGLLREGLADQQLTLGKFEIAEARAESRDGERRSAEERAFQGDRQSQQRRRQQSPNTPFEPFEVVA